MPSEPIVADNNQSITNPSFTFMAGSIAANKFDVMSFEGNEQISQPFEYRLVVKFDGATPPFNVVNKDATFMLGPTVIKGIVAKFQVLREAEQVSQSDSRKLICEAVLVPKLWRLGLTRRSRVFKNGTVKDIVKRVVDAELPSGDYDFDAIVPNVTNRDAFNPYPVREFVTQYQETDLDFINRILEDAGIYYFFRDGKMIFCESREQHVPVGNADESQQALTFTAAQGALLSNASRVFSFVANEQVVPRGFSVNDYDFETFEGPAWSTNPSDSDNDPKRVGEQNEYGYHIPERREAGAVDGEGLSPVDLTALMREKRLERIALIRAQEIEAQRRKRMGKSNIPLIRAGHTFSLSNHFYVGSDEKQLVTGVHHSYRNVRYKVRSDVEYDHDNDTSTAALDLGDAETTSYDLVYKNEFLCVPNDVQYRPPRVTEVPRIPGIMTARVKGNTEEGKAHLDSEGRYHIRLPFDSDPYDLTSCGPSSEPSRPVRLTQPYSGKDYGIHFPNQEGAEMVFAYLDGNPDRPLGLGTVPTPWNHTPVPNQKLKMRTQNPWSGALPFSGNDSYTIEDSLFYDENKNVIRTRLGHQIVMDDNDGSANVGITIQTGNTDPFTNKRASEIEDGDDEGDSTAEERYEAWKVRNKYWFSRIDMGGYRVKSGVEQIIDGATEVMGYLTTLASREFLQFASLALAVGKATAESGDYLSDTYGATTPVGVNIRTDQSINLNGANGVNIVSPNVFGMFSSSFVGDNKEQKIAQHYIENIYKATNSLIFQDIMNDTVDEFKEAAEVYDDHKKKGHSASKKKTFFKWKKQFKKARVKALVYTLLQRSGINIHSAGELKMSSLSSTTVVAGEGGVAIKSSGNIEQNASRGFEIDSHEGISISTKGRPYTGKAAADQALDFLGIIAPPLATFVKGITSKKESKDIADKDDRLPLALTNESGDITLNTQHKGDIFYHAEGGGNIIGLAERGRVLHRSSDEIVSEVGFKSPKPGPIHEPMEDADKGEDISIAKQAFNIWKDADEKKIEAYRKYKDSKYALTWKLKRVDRFPGLVASNAANRLAANAKFQLQSAIGSRIKQTQDAVEIFAQNGISINTVDNNSKSYIKIEKDKSIEIVCGKSKVLLDKKGNITIDGKGDLILKGKKVQIQGKTQVQIKSKKIVTDCKIKENKSKMFKNVTKLAKTDAKLHQAKASLTMVG